MNPEEKSHGGDGDQQTCQKEKLDPKKMLQQAFNIQMTSMYKDTTYI